jgi:Uma2 family endonuclease
MRIEVEKKLFTVDEYHRMCDSGIIGFEERAELIDGEIIKMTSPSTRHVGCTNRATTYFTEAFGRRAIVSIQNPLLLTLRRGELVSPLAFPGVVFKLEDLLG